MAPDSKKYNAVTDNYTCGKEEGQFEWIGPMKMRKGM